MMQQPLRKTFFSFFWTERQLELEWTNEWMFLEVSETRSRDGEKKKINYYYTISSLSHPTMS